MHLNNKNNRYIITAATTIFTIAIMTALIMATTPAAATTSTTTTTTTTSPEEAGMIELSQEPVYQELRRPISNIPINETHLSVTYTGNGTLILPDTGEPINTTSNGSALVSFMTQSAVASETLRTEDGETATVTIHEILPFDPAATNGETRGIAIAVIHTELTEGGGRLAPLNGMALAGIDEIHPNDDSHLTLREWQRGIASPPTATTEEPPLMDDTTTTTTDATTTTTTTDAADTNATAGTEEEEGEEAAIGVGEGQLSPEEEQQAAEEEAAIATSATNNSTIPPAPRIE